MELNLDSEAALLQAILFLESEPMDEGALSRISGLGKDVTEAALEHLKDVLAGPCHGLELTRMGGGWMLAPKQDLWAMLKDRYGRKNEQKISRAAMETLSIVAYSQPVTRAEVESIRGVAADNMIRFLLEKEFIKEVGKKDSPGKPIQYGTTREFLKFFRLSSIAELPKLDELDRERFELDGSQ
ncbi:MAG: SMC-Scp complex subunit ScpB [Spirochaetales bacterium]|nr:MAG: SMC-Scp complex subunit ScpB [Spirochaetales bacterium]